MPELYAMLAVTRRPLFARCLRVLGDACDAEDAVQETAIRAWRAWERETFATEKHAVNWLYRVAHNLCLDELRRRRLRNQSLYPLGVQMPGRMDVEATVEQWDDLRVIDMAIGGMSEDYREAIVAAVHGYSQRERAAMMGVTAGAMKSKVLRARAQLRKRVA